MSCSCRRRSRSFALFSVAFLSVLVSGCVTLPEFDKLSGITPTTIVEVVKCELIWAKKDHDELRSFPPWVAVAELTLQVDETTSLTPSFTHTDVVSRSLSRLFNWGVKLDTRAKRIYTQSVTFNMDDSLQDPAGHCANRDSVDGVGFALNGRLGLSEIVGMAFGSAKYVPGEGNEGGHLESNYFTLRDAAPGGPKKGAKSKYFGQTLEFVVTKNINKVGPTWVLSFFKGPGGFLTMERGDTNKLLISFAPNEGLAAYSNATLRDENQTSRLNQIQQSLESF